jgi:hypothetical protein
MQTFNRWVWDFVTPSIGSGFWAGFAQSDFIINIPMGNISDGGVDRHSTVVASVCELAAAPGHPFDFPFIGAASMEVRNIAPRDDGILSLLIHVDWATPLHIRLHLLVTNG